jgi:hypothetical protein
MDIRPEAVFVLTLTEKDYKLLSACVAVCAGVKGVRVNPKEAHDMNLKMTGVREAHAAQQLEIAQAARQRALTHDPIDTPDLG